MILAAPHSLLVSTGLRRHLADPPKRVKPSGSGASFRLLCTLLTVAGLMPTLASAAESLPDRPRIGAVKAAIPPEIDGRLDDPAWQEAALIDGLRQEIPVAFGVPSQKTEVRILYDADFVYFGVRAYDTEPDKIIAKQMLRDADMALDDRVSFNIDTLHDQRNGYFFQVNPLGNKRDGLIDNGAIKFNWERDLVRGRKRGRFGLHRRSGHSF